MIRILIALPPYPVARVREGNLIATEGDFDRIVNRIAVRRGKLYIATHASANRLSVLPK